MTTSNSPWPDWTPKLPRRRFSSENFWRRSKVLPVWPDGLDARGDEGAEVVAQMVEGEEEPLAVDVGEVIGIDDALLGLLLAGLAIGQLQLLARGGGLGQRVEDLQVQDRLGAGAEGDGLLDVGQAERNGVGQGLLHLPEGAQQRLLEAGAAVLLEGLLGHDQREEFAFRDLQGGEGLDGLGVVDSQSGCRRTRSAAPAGRA